VRRRALSLRLRLTLSYGAAFFALGFLLIAISYLLVRQFLIHNPGEFLEHVAADLGLSQSYLSSHIPAPQGGQETVRAFTRSVQDQVVSHLLRGLTGMAFVALAGAALVAVGLGWLLAGRMLRPLQEIATAAERASASTLHERIAMPGPDDELRRLADTFDAMLARLEAAFEAQREFVADASHELRTPLAIMRTEVEVTLADPQASEEELRGMAETVRGAISRSEDVVDKLLILAESERRLEREPVDLGGLLGEAVQRQAQAAAARDLSFALDSRSATVAGDAALLGRLVDNLIDNAVKYAALGSSIEASVVTMDGRVTLRVANAGEAIAAEEVPHLFERFYRRGSSRSRREGGSGLGMAIVAAVAEAHGGSVTAEGPASGGLIVTVLLPCDQASSAHGMSKDATTIAAAIGREGDTTSDGDRD
jgi:signal transduction histidine kinase